MTKFDEIVASLPDPKKDPMPPRVRFTEEGEKVAKRAKKQKRALLDPKNDTERQVKYVLGSLCSAVLEKDGDFVAIAGGREVWRKKTADYRGYYVVNTLCLHVYVEVKGISPGNPFALSRLDKPNTKGGKSQHEKLTRAHMDGSDVWLALGWWDAPGYVNPIMVETKRGPVQKWTRSNLDLSIALIHWSYWLQVILPMLKYRSIRQVDRHLLNGCWIVKRRNRWQFEAGHWFQLAREQFDNNPQFGYNA